MTASDLYKAGRLQDAIDEQIREVKASPADHAKRLFLFELLAFAGDLARARKQIEAIQFNEMERDTAVMSYRKNLDAEEARRKLWTDGVEPKFLAPPPDHVQLRLKAVQSLRNNEPTEAANLLAQAAQAAPAVQGLLNNKPFTGLRDADDLFASVLEVFAQGVYYWLPLEQVDALAMNPPKYPRDLIWFPARLDVRDGPSGEAFLPVLYHGSHEHPDDNIKLARSNDWKELENGPILGLGARIFLVGEEDIPLLQWRELHMT
jgi:type VI secretion system protein ImpE